MTATGGWFAVGYERRLKTLVKLLVTAALVALILWQLGGLAPLAAAFRDLRWPYVAALVAVTIADRGLMTFNGSCCCAHAPSTCVTAKL